MITLNEFLYKGHAIDTQSSSWMIVNCYGDYLEDFNKKYDKYQVKAQERMDSSLYIIPKNELGNIKTMTNNLNRGEWISIAEIPDKYKTYIDLKNKIETGKINFEEFESYKIIYENG